MQCIRRFWDVWDMSIGLLLTLFSCLTYVIAIDVDVCLFMLQPTLLHAQERIMEQPTCNSVDGLMLGTCESFFCVRIESRIESAVRFDFESNF